MNVQALSCPTLKGFHFDFAAQIGSRAYTMTYNYVLGDLDDCDPARRRGAKAAGTAVPVQVLLVMHPELSTHRAIFINSRACIIIGQLPLTTLPIHIHNNSPEQNNCSQRAHWIWDSGTRTRCQSTFLLPASSTRGEKIAHAERQASSNHCASSSVGVCTASSCSQRRFRNAHSDSPCLVLHRLLDTNPLLKSGA